MHSKEPLGFLLPMLKTPHIFNRAISAMYHKHFKAKKEFWRGDGKSRLGIQQISIKITNACNLRCKTCGQWGETGYNFSKPSSELKKIVPVETYKAMSNQVKGSKPIYYIWGGEPFLYPGLMDFTQTIKDNKSILALVTNSTFLEDHAEEIVKQGWDALMFSIDGPKDVHDDIRGKAGTFDKMVRGIEAINKYKRKMKKQLPFLMPLITISVWNAHKLDEIFEVANELGTDCIVAYYSWFTNEKIGEAHTKVFQREFGITPTSWKGYLFDHNVDTEALKASLERIRNRKWKQPIIYIPDLDDDQLKDYYEKPGELFGYGPCISPWMTVEIMPNGDVSPCRDYPDYICGNITEKTLPEIWNDEPYIKFRKALTKNNGLFPVCSRCCGLMGW